MTKTIKITKYSVLAVALTVLSGASTTHAQTFGINFLGNTSDNVTGTAGVVPVSGWNNIGNSYTSGGILANDGVTASTLSISGAYPGDGGWHSGSTSDGGNGSLMDGYLDLGANNGGSLTTTLSGLSGSSYDIFVYIFSDASHPGNSGDWLSNYSINGTTYYAPQLGNGTTTYNSTSTTVGGAFTGFVRATTYGANFNTQTANASDFGNYIEIDNVAPVGGVITIVSEADTQSWRSPLDGIEVETVPEPSVLAFSAVGGLLGLLGLARRRGQF